MLKKIVLSSIIILIFIGCDLPTNNVPYPVYQDTTTIKEVTTINNIPVIWKGSLPVHPADPVTGWAYYNTVQKTAYIWDGDNWQIMAQDGISIIWKGELPFAPSGAETNWAYYNIIDGNSYIYHGNNWDLLAKSGRDGASGILLWIGTLAAAPANPSAGWAYHNSVEGVSYIWSNGNWEILARDGQNGTNGSNGTNGVSIVWKGALPNDPSNPQLNWAYYNTVTNKSYIWDESDWQILAESGSSTILVSIVWQGSLTAAPPVPQIGWMYYNSVLGKTYIWDGSVWNIVAQDGQNGTSPEGFLIAWKGGLSTAPGIPERGWAYYNTSQKKSFIWDGSTWQILAQDGADSSGGGGDGGGTTYNGSWLYAILYTKEGNYIQYAQTTLAAADFGKVDIGSSTRTTTFYIGIIGGTGNTTLNLTGNPPIQISGTDADCFSVSQPSSTSTTTGTYIMDASIIFTPNSAGVKTAIITIPNNSPDQPDFSFTVTGKGSMWPKIYDGGEGDGDDQIKCSVIDSQGNIYFIGYGFELINHHSGNDWWIKKINSAGIEITSGWNKKLDFYDNYAYSSNTHDRPTNAIIDGSDNLVVSDGYYTIKFASDGTEMWRKNTGGTLYKDSQNNVFIVTGSSITKYNPAGAQLWTKAYTGKLAFDNANNVVVYSGDILRYISSNGTENWLEIAGDFDAPIFSANGWYNSSLEAGQAEYWKFPVVDGTTYSVRWNDRIQGDGTKTGDVKVSAYWQDDNASIFSTTDSGWNTPKNFLAVRTGNIVVKIETFSSGASYAGTYALQVGDWYNDGTSIADGWYNSSLSANGNELRIIPVTEGTRYFIAWNSSYQGDGTKTGNVEVSAYWQDDNVSIFSATHGGWTSPQNFIASRSGNIVVKIKTYSSSASYAGTYAVVVKAANHLIPNAKFYSMSAINSAVFDHSGNIYVAGYGNKLIDQYSKKDVWLKKYDPSGTEITGGWNKKYDWGHSEDETAETIIYDGINIIVIGQGDDIISGSSKNDTWVKKFTPDGIALYAFAIPDNSAELVKIDNSENYYFSSGSATSTLLRKYNTSGTLLQSYSWNSKSPYVYPPSYLMDSSNNVYMYGYASNLVTSVSGNDWIIRKFDSAGVEQ